MFQRERIVTVGRGDKRLCVYAGADGVEALKVFEREVANTENEDVRYYNVPPYTKLRFPARDHATEVARKERAEADEAARIAAATQSAEDIARAEKERLEAEEAERKAAGLTAGPAPVTPPPKAKAPKAKAPKEN